MANKNLPSSLCAADMEIRTLASRHWPVSLQKISAA